MMHPMKEPDDDQTTTRRRMSVRQAAESMGVTVEAIRGRIKRDTIPHGKAEDGSVYVWLDNDQPGDQTQPADDQDGDRTASSATLVEALREQVAFLQDEMQRRDERHAEEIRRRDHLLAAALNRIPELPPQSRQDAPGAPAESAGGYEAPRTPAGPEKAAQSAQDADQDEPRSWWRRIFGG
jgi:hypothetical protein